MNELFRNLHQALPSDMPILTAHMWNCMGAVAGGMTNVVDMMFDNWPMAFQRTEGAKHAVQSPSGYYGFRAMRGFDDHSKIMKPVPSDALYFAGHHVDHELVELAMQLPPELKIKNGGKHVLKIIARGLLPDAVIDRPKGYFPVPALKFVRGAFLDFMRDILNTEACQQRGIFQRPYLDKLLAEPEAHMTRLLGSKLWHAALLELWLQLNVDQRA